MAGNKQRFDSIASLVAGWLVIVAPLIIGPDLFAEPFWMLGALVPGSILIASARSGLCPFYAPVGLTTCKVTHR